MSTASLFKPLAVGPLQLAHRVVMAPLTRMRADPQTNAPVPMNAVYYGQRATDGGLIIAEASQVSQQGKGALAIDGPITFGHFQDKIIESPGGILAHLLLQKADVMGLDVVAVLVADGGCNFPRFVFFTEAQQVVAELHFGRQKGGIKFESQPLMGSSFSEPVGP